MRILVALVMLLPFTMEAQEIFFTAGSYTGCDAAVVDSGGNGGPYSAGEDLTFVICPEAPETIVNIDWVIFDLANEGDTMFVYDGPDVNSQPMGQFTGDQLQGVIQAASESAGGCITLHFTSAGAGGNFAFIVACGEPCFPPLVVVNGQGEDNPALICQGEDITLDATQSEFGDNALPDSYLWSFGDGETLTTTEAIVSHSYDEPGIYRINLTITDSNGCESLNLADYFIYVSTTPDFTGTSEDLEICLGQEISLEGVVTTETFEDLPDANFGGALFIPDVQGECFSSELTFQAFEAGNTVTSVSDFVDVFINFEHSYMGDLLISLICPNGQTLILQSQGGANTYLGIPVDDEANQDEPGIGFDYFWSPTATNGTWTEESVGVGTLPSGVYSASGDWSDLEGCPLNGTWAIEVCDLFGFDNGFIFDWSLNFDPSLFPELLSFTPSIGVECDSTFWSGPFITSETADCNGISIEPQTLGNQTYTYTAIDNHGCTYTTEVNVNVTQGPIAAGPTVVYVCDGQAQLNAQVTNPEAGVQYTYEWTPGDFLSNANVANPQINGLEDPSTYSVFVAPVGAPECGSSWDVDVEIPLPPVPLEYDELDACAGSTFGIPSPNQPDGWDYVYEWVNLSAVDPDAVIGTGNNLQATESGNYQLTVTMEAPCFYTAVGDVDIVFNACELGPIPNVFTPNGDQINDRFLIEGLQFFSGTKLRVYNRWGGLVFESDNYQNNWSPSASDLAEGTYYYIMEVDFRDERGVETFSGTVNIFRN